MKCPICAKGDLVRDTRDIPYTSTGRITVIPGVSGDFCLACGEAILEPTESARISAMMLEFNKQAK